MGKRKLFEKIDQTLPVTGAERSSKGVIQFPLATIPPTATSVPIGRIAGGQRNFDFKDFYGHGVDEVAFALQRQIERFVAGEEKNLANASVLTICRCGVTPFLDYMIARSTAEQRDFTLGDINRNLIDGFLGWLRHGDTKLGSQRSCYSSFKSVLFSLGKRGLITVVDEGDDRTFPKNPFPGAFRSHKGAKPDSAERTVPGCVQRLLQAVSAGQRTSAIVYRLSRMLMLWSCPPLNSDPRPSAAIEFDGGACNR
jgi:hypothetical protein